MKIGLSIPFLVDATASDPLHQTYTLAQKAEQAGFDFLSMGHHVFTPAYPTSAPFTILAAIAARTERIRLASVIYLLPLYHPVAVAEQVATLDVISGGRVIFGVGVGYRPYEFEGFGVDPKHRGARADEALAAIRHAWATGRFDHQGRHFHIPDLPAVPLPVQPSGPPIWVGGVSAAAMKRAARFGDAWVSANMQPLEDIKSLAATYRDLCAGEGRPGSLCVSRDFWVAESRDEMVRDWYGDMLERHLGFRKMGFVSSDPGGLYARLDAGETVSPEAFIEDRMIAGTPEDCAAQIKHWRAETGCASLLLLLSKQATFPQLCRLIDLYGAEVLPQVQAEAAGTENMVDALGLEPRTR